MSPLYVSHIAYSVGMPRPIDALAESEGLSAEALRAFHQRGLRDYRDDPRSVGGMCVASALETLASAGLQPTDIETVVIANSNADAIVEDDDETALLAALRGAGFERCRVLGLTLQACSAFADAVQVAGSFLETRGPARSVLVVIFGQKQKTSRLGPQQNLVFSDGAASCVVSDHEGAFEVCATGTVTNTRLAAMGRGGNIAQFHGGLVELRDLAEKICLNAGVRFDELRAFFGTNAGAGHLRLMAQGIGLPPDLVYEDDVADFSHVHSCDSLISLANFSKRYAMHASDLFLIASWSPHVFSAALLRYVGIGVMSRGIRHDGRT